MIHPDYQGYTGSPYAAATLGTAQQLFNGRMAGASIEEQNVLANQANQQATVARTATNGAQALAIDAAMQGQTNQGFHNIQLQENQNKYQLLNNLNMANAGETQEGDKAYQSKLQKYIMDTNQQSALRGAGATNISNGIGGVESAATGGIMGSGKKFSGGSSGGLLGAILGLI